MREGISGIGGPRAAPSVEVPETTATDDVWYKADQIAQEAAKYVFDNFATISLCTGTNITDTCAQNFVRAFAAKIYRRPLDANETTDINKVYTDVKGFGGTIQEATQYAVLSSLYALPGKLLMGTSGFMVDALGYGDFFLYTATLSIPGLLMLYWLSRRDIVVAARN